MLLEPLRDRHKALAADLGLNEEDAITLQSDAEMRPYQWSLALI
jgi:hypothetical protein